MATNSCPMYTDTPLAAIHTPQFETGEVSGSDEYESFCLLSDDVIIERPFHPRSIQNGYKP